MGIGCIAICIRPVRVLLRALSGGDHSKEGSQRSLSWLHQSGRSRMRVPVRGHASRRAAREGSNLNSTAVSVLINVLLVAVLLYGYYAGPSMP